MCWQAEMKKQFIRLTSGWIPVSVLVLFTIALVAGQARASLSEETRATPVPPLLTTSVEVDTAARTVTLRPGDFGPSSSGMNAQSEKL